MEAGQCPEGWLGGGRGSHAWRGPGGSEDQGGVHIAFPPPTQPRKPAGLPGLILCPLRPPLATGVLGT